MNGACSDTNYFVPAPGSLGRGQKVKYHLISITKIFKPNFVCLLTSKMLKTYQTGFSSDRLGHAKGMGLWCAEFKNLIF